MSHKQLTREQRYHIYGLWKAGYKDTEISKEVGVHKSTIGREFVGIAGGTDTILNKPNVLVTLVGVQLKRE